MTIDRRLEARVRAKLSSRHRLIGGRARAVLGTADDALGSVVRRYSHNVARRKLAERLLAARTPGSPLLVGPGSVAGHATVRTGDVRHDFEFPQQMPAAQHQPDARGISRGDGARAHANSPLDRSTEED